MKAISIALIPTQTLALQALIDLSAEVSRENTFLNLTDQLPHVTLGMNLSPDSEVKRIIQAVSAWQAVQLTISGVSSIPRNNGSDLVWLNFERNLMQLALHEKGHAVTAPK